MSQLTQTASHAIRVAFVEAKVQRELRARNASKLDQNLRSHEVGNWVDHTKLFDGSVQE